MSAKKHHLPRNKTILDRVFKHSDLERFASLSECGKLTTFPRNTVYLDNVTCQECVTARINWLIDEVEVLEGKLIKKDTNPFWVPTSENATYVHGPYRLKPWVHGSSRYMVTIQVAGSMFALGKVENLTAAQSLAEEKNWAEFFTPQAVDPIQ